MQAHLAAGSCVFLAPAAVVWIYGNGTPPLSVDLIGAAILTAVYATGLARAWRRL